MLRAKPLPSLTPPFSLSPLSSRSPLFFPLPCLGDCLDLRATAAGEEEGTDGGEGERNRVVELARDGGDFSGLNGRLPLARSLAHAVVAEEEEGYARAWVAFGARQGDAANERTGGERER